MVTEIAGLQKQLDITTRRLNALREEYAIAYDANQRFSLEEQIRRLEAEVDQLQQKITSATGLDFRGDVGLLEAQIRQLSIDQQIGEWHLVNCDRFPEAKLFWESFDHHLQRHHPFQFYFVVACPTQQPSSFSERMIYEVIIEELEEEYGAINYVRREDGRRVQVEDLPLGRNLRNSQRKFKKYFSERFGLDRQNTRFETYIQTGLPRLEYEFVATVFDLNASRWDKPLMAEYLQWLLDTFGDTHAEVPNFIFFFSIFLQDAHHQPMTDNVQAVLDSLNHLNDNNAGRCSLIAQLPPVPDNLVKDWIRDLGEHNQSKIDRLVSSVVMGLPAPKQQRYQQKKELDMADIELFQQKVYRIANQ